MKYLKSVCACAVAALSVGCASTDYDYTVCDEYMSGVSLTYQLPMDRVEDAGDFIEEKTEYLKELMSDPAFIRSSSINSSISLYHDIDYETNEMQESEMFGAYMYASFDGTPEAVTLLLQSEGYISIDISQCHEQSEE
uniref:hypothetical protein n=1 Tax=Thaumasiovibrio occultus TaxID=1891184 RepID=UPI000B3611CA|nr:hypothetical protein [Thaumasiovibrio occultus]